MVRNILHIWGVDGGGFLGFRVGLGSSSCGGGGDERWRLWVLFVSGIHGCWFGVLAAFC